MRAHASGRSAANRASIGIARIAFLAGVAHLFVFGGVLYASIERGLVVEEVANGSAGERAGIRDGDVLLSWKRAANPPANPKPTQGQLETPFDLGTVEVEEAPRGLVTFGVERDGRSVTVEIAPGNFGLTVRPRFGGRDLDDWNEGKRFFGGSEARDAGRARWEVLAQRTAAGGSRKSRRAAWWIRLRMATELSNGGETEAAHACARGVVLEAEGAKDWIVVAESWRAEAGRFERENEPARAEQAYRERLAACEKHAPQSLAVAASLNSLGNVLADRSDLGAAEDFYRRSLAIREKLAPGSLVMAGSLNNLGLVAGDRGDLAAADDLFRRFLAITEKFAPGSLDVASSLNNLGLVAWNRGDLAAADDFYRRAISIVENFAPGSLPVATILSNLAAVAQNRGDLATADDLCRRALAIRERLAPGSVGVAASLNDLGAVALNRGDLAAADDLFQRSLAIKEKLTPGSLDVAMSLSNLGLVAEELGDLAAADDFYRRSIAIREKLAPESLGVAASLTNLGLVASDQGDLAAADDLFRRSLAIEEKLAPGSVDFAMSLTSLAAVEAANGDPPDALRLLGEANAIYRRLAPESTNAAKNFHTLAKAALSLGRRGDAADHYCESLRALEAQTVHLGGSDEAKNDFAAKYLDWYRDYAALLLQLGEPEAAFHVLERSRARGLLALLAERDLVFSEDVAPELERERRFAAADYDRAQAKLSNLSATDDAAIQTIESEMREIRRRQEEIQQKIRAASPHLASLVDSEPLDLEGAVRLLDPGTVLLAYSTGEESAKLFVADRVDWVGGERAGSLSVFELPITRDELRDEIESFRREIRIAAESGNAQRSEKVKRIAASLSSRLLGPASKAIAAAERIVIVPDGPLHFLPFAALASLETAAHVLGTPEKAGTQKRKSAAVVDPGLRGDDGRAGTFHFLIESKPIHTVLSMTVYGELLSTRRQQPGETAAPAPAGPSIVAFGDPLYPDDAGTRMRSGTYLDPLPATRTEVETLRALSPSTTTAYLGAEATEAQAKRLDKDARVVHFACHGVIDQRFPLDSALALSIPEEAPDILSDKSQENGFLQAWEIFEKVRLDADLVTLSACETAMGKEVGGEGLVGLVRAFQFAGARSILASLWSVNDESTSTLMTNFYRRWEAGASKDEALRQAQIEMLRSGGPLHALPYHWAAFELIGDWR